MEGRIFKRLIVAFAFSIVFIMIAKFFLGKTMEYLTEAVEKKKQAGASQAVSAPEAATSIADTQSNEPEALDDVNLTAASGVIPSDSDTSIATSVTVNNPASSTHSDTANNVP